MSDISITGRSALSFAGASAVDAEIVGMLDTIAAVSFLADLDYSQAQPVAPGTPLTLALTARPVPGATGVEVASATVSVDPVQGGPGVPLASAGVHAQGNALRVTLGAAPRSVRSLAFTGLQRADTGAAVDGLRLTVTPRAGPTPFPAAADPRTPGQAPVPSLLGGARRTGGTLALDPDLRAASFDVAAVEGDFPTDFSTVTLAATGVTVTVAPGPEDLEVSGPDGAPVLASPGLLAAAATADVSGVAERAFAAAVAAGAPLSVPFTVTVGAAGLLRSATATWQGAVVRAAAGPVAVRVDGAPAPVVMDGPPLGARAPRSVTADVTVEHDGVSLHAASDPLPAPGVPLAGTVVRGAPVARPLASLDGARVVRVGLPGVAEPGTTLSVRVGGGDPAVVDAAPPDQGGWSVVWLDLPAPVEGPDRLEVTATAGAFRWVGDAVRLGVVADPSTTPVVLGAPGTVLVPTGRTTVAAARSLPTAAFTGAGPVVASTGFLTVRLDRLTLRYDP